MTKNFICQQNDSLLKGIVLNIPDNTPEPEILDRINGSILNVSNISYENDMWDQKEIDIEIDWFIKDDIQINKDLLAVQDIMEKDEEHSLVSEIVYYALKYMKENPKLSIAEAISCGYDEFIK